MVTAAHASSRSHTAAQHRPWLGYAGFGWALSYIPIHVYWALGGLTTWIGITASEPSWRAANWGASLVILGAGLICLSLVQRWGQVLPRGVRHGAAWVGGVAGIAHCLAFSTVAVMRLSGMIAYPAGTGLTLRQLHNYDWANVVYFEPWFGIMGVALIGSSVWARRRRRMSLAVSGQADDTLAAPAWMRRAAWARPLSLAVLGVAAFANLVWAAGSHLGMPSSTGHAALLIAAGHTGMVRPVAAVAGAALAAVAVAVARRKRAGWSAGGTALTLAGLFAVIWGVFTFDPWTFAGYGPAVMAAGLLTQIAYVATYAKERHGAGAARERAGAGPAS